MSQAITESTLLNDFERTNKRVSVIERALTTLVPICMVGLNITVGHTSGVTFAISWSEEIKDDLNMHAPGSSLIEVDRDGLWMVGFRDVMLITPGSASTLTGSILVNGGGVPDSPAMSLIMTSGVSFTYYAAASNPMSLIAGDSISLQLTHNGTNLAAHQIGSLMWCYYLGN